MADTIAIRRLIADIPALSPDPTPSAVFLTETGKRFVLPFAPRQMEASGYAGEWTDVARPGDTPLVIRSARGLPQQSFTIELLTGPDWTYAIEDILADLRAIAESGERLTFSYGPSEAGLWTMTTLSVTSTERSPGTNLITEATADITLRRASSAGTRVGPLSGGVQVSQVATLSKSQRIQGYAIAEDGTIVPPGFYDNPVTSATKRHRVGPGESLWGIAVKFYGNGSRWPEIADRNGIRDAKKLAVGQELTIP